MHFGEEPDSREIVIGELCANLDGNLHTTGTRVTSVRGAFEEFGPDILVVAVNEMWSLPFEVCTLIENNHGEQDIASHIARFESEITGIEERPTHEFLSLARTLITAYEHGGDQ